VSQRKHYYSSLLVTFLQSRKHAIAQRHIHHRSQRAPTHTHAQPLARRMPAKPRVRFDPHAELRAAQAAAQRLKYDMEWAAREAAAKAAAEAERKAEHAARLRREHEYRALRDETERYKVRGLGATVCCMPWCVHVRQAAHDHSALHGAIAARHAVLCDDDCARSPRPLPLLLTPGSAPTCCAPACRRGGRGSRPSGTRATATAAAAEPTPAPVAALAVRAAAAC
jgi:hypothetical protein